MRVDRAILFAKTRWGAGLVLFAVAASLVAVGGGAEGSTRPRYGGEAKVIWTEPMFASDPTVANLPSERALGALIYETLFELTNNGPRPLLVESWTANDDSTDWTLDLKRNVRFHNGKDLTADDVVYSLRRVMESPDPSPYKWLLRKLLAVTSPPESETAGEPQVSITVTFSFSEPEPALPHLLSCPGLVVLPFGFSRFEPDSGILAGMPPGTGSFKLERGKPPTEMELKANEDHHMGRPFLDSITWNFAPVDEGLVEFQAGAAVSLAGIPSPLTAELTTLPAGTRRSVSESSYTLYLGCNPSHPDLSSSENRHKILGAVDRSSMLTSIVGRSGRLASSFIAGRRAKSTLWGSQGALPHGDETTGGTGTSGVSGTRASARDNSGRERRSGAASQGDLTLLVPRWHSLIAEIGDRIQVDLMGAGYGVRVRKVGREEFVFKLAEGDFDLFVGLWAPNTWQKDADWLSVDFRETQLAPVPSLAAAVASVGAGSTSALEEILAEEALLLPLFHMDLVVFLGDGLVTPEAGSGRPPDLAWSWLKTGGR